jgi:hypothetical protein
MKNFIDTDALSCADGIFPVVLGVRIFDMETKEIIYYSIYIISLLLVVWFSLRGRKRMGRDSD